MSESRHRLVWTVANMSTLPLWLAMIVAPRSSATKWMMDRLVPLLMALGLTYAASLATAVATSPNPPDFSSPEKVSALFQNPDAMVAGWTHYLAFDVFVGRWIWQTSLEEGRPARLALLLTWWAGPVGLTMFLARDRIPFRLP